MQLVIAEKPSVGVALAKALGVTEKKDGYIEGNGYIVSWCVGHLVSLANADMYDEKFKKWDIADLPIIPDEWQFVIAEDKNKQFGILRQLMDDSRVTEVVNACDAGREGELIFRLVYNKALCNKPIKRLWISSMEEKAIREGFSNLKDGNDYENLYQSALCRAKADWIVGINATRLFSKLYNRTLNVGRVQTPTLAMLYERENSISNFQKEKYFNVHLKSVGLDAVHEKVKEQGEAENIRRDCDGKEAIVKSVKTERKTVNPPHLYDLTTLQREANRLYGFTAQQTLDYTQSLYEMKLVTYPRTDSQYITDDMDGTARSIAESVAGKLPHFSGIVIAPETKRVINNKKVSDHHAISRLIYEFTTSEMIGHEEEVKEELREFRENHSEYENCEISYTVAPIGSLVNNMGCLLGMFAAFAGSLCICILSVGKDRFFTNWWWTVMRIPKYRLGYFVNKILSVMFPLVFYWFIREHLIKTEIYLYNKYTGIIPEGLLEENISEQFRAAQGGCIFCAFGDPLRGISILSLIIIFAVSAYLCVNSLAGKIKHYFIRFVLSLAGFALTLAYLSGTQIPFAVMPVTAAVMIAVSLIGLYSKNY